MTADGEDQVDAVVRSWRNDLSDTSDETFAFTRRVVRLAGRMEAVLQRVLPGYNLSKAEFDVMTTLANAGPSYRLRPTELREQTVLTSGGTSNTLRRLAARELVSREADQSDARVVWVSLSPAGHALIVRALRDVAREHDHVLRPALQALPSANRALREVLRLLES